MKVYISYPDSHITIHTDDACSLAQLQRSTAQRHMSVTMDHLGDVLKAFIENAVPFSEKSGMADILLEVKLDSEQQNMAFVSMVQAIIGREYEQMTTASVTVHGCIPQVVAPVLEVVEESAEKGDLTRQFHADLMAQYEAAKKRCKFSPPRFLQMVREYGAVNAVRRLLDSSEKESGFADLMRCGCRELSVEALALREQYQNFFTEEQLARARERVG